MSNANVSFISSLLVPVSSGVSMMLVYTLRALLVPGSAEIVNALKQNTPFTAVTFVVPAIVVVLELTGCSSPTAEFSVEIRLS